MMLHGKYAALDYKTQLPFCFFFYILHYPLLYTKRSCFSTAPYRFFFIVPAVILRLFFSLFPTTPSGKSPGRSALIQGSGFLLACGCLRWRSRDTCLSEASCVSSSPPLAVSRELRGTFPELPSTPDRRLAAYLSPNLNSGT